MYLNTKIFLSTMFFICIAHTPYAHATLPKNAMNQWRLLEVVERCEFGTIITQTDLPYAITQPGIYSFIEDMTTSTLAGPAITINSSNVTLNLNNHMLTSNNTTAIECIGFTDVQIFNGYIVTPANISIYLESCEQILIWDVNVKSYAGTAISINDCVNVIVDGCDFDPNNAGVGATVAILDGSLDTYVSECTIRDPLGSDGFFMSSDSQRTTFQDCEVVSTDNAAPTTGTGFNILGSDVLLTNCAATKLNGTGFIIPLKSITLENCRSQELVIGFDFINGTQGAIVDNCEAVGCTTGYRATNCQDLIISDSFAIAGTTGFFIDSSSRTLLTSCLAHSNTSYGFHTQASQYIAFESCTASLSGINGFLLDDPSTVTPPIASLKNCVANNCTTAGFRGDAAVLGNIVIKDSLFCRNTGPGINGSNLVILDTRSSSVVVPVYNLNGAVDIVPGATIITY